MKSSRSVPWFGEKCAGLSEAKANMPGRRFRPKSRRMQAISRTGPWPEGRRYFNFYNNGKSMVRVGDGVYPLGAHRWARDGVPLNWVSFFNPAILHFSVCGFSAFEQKYRHRGNFSDMRMNKDLRKSGATLDLDARDAFAEGDITAAEKIYRERVMVDPETAARLLDAGILKRFNLDRLLADQGSPQAR